MKMIYKIAKKELQLLFYSPIAWLLLLCFIIQTALFISMVYEQFAIKMENTGYSFRASESFFVSGSFGLGLWYKIQDFLYFYIPLLTMGIVSRELSSGSVKLLYSSPISNTQIILGKFLSMVIYATVLMAVLLSYVILAWCTIKDFEILWVLTGLLGLFLLTCTYMAVGIFISSLTSYQIIAAVGTFIVLMLLSMVGGWGQEYDFVREVTYWLSIDGRASSFIQGMICSEDMLYFPVVMGMFLALTIIRLHAVRQKERFGVTFGKDAIVVFTVCIIAFLSSQPALTGYYDTTSTQKNTLTPISREIVDKVDGGMTITSYVNILQPHWEGRYKYPGFIMENRKQFRHYTRFKPEIKQKVVYYYAETPNPKSDESYDKLSPWGKARVVCERTDMDSTMLKTKEEIDQMVDLSKEGYTFIRQIVRANGQKEWLRVYSYGSQYPGEAEISAALKRMVMKLPKIGFTTGHGERSIYDSSPQGYSFIGSNKAVQYSVWNQGFDVEEITLDKPVPQDINILIIADLQEELTPEEDAYLQEYIDRGESLFILGEPRHRESINPTLRKHFGLELTPLVVGRDIRFKGTLPANVLACIPTPEAKKRMYYLKNSLTMNMPNCSGIEQVEDKGYTLCPYYTCDTLGTFWTELETKDFMDDTVRFNPAIGEVSNVFNTMVGLTRSVNGKEQRIVVSGDSECLTNNEFTISRGNSTLNHYIMLGTSYWLSHENAPIDVRRPLSTDNKVYITLKGSEMVKWGFLWLCPFVVFGAGIYLWIRRRGR